MSTFTQKNQERQNRAADDYLRKESDNHTTAQLADSNPKVIAHKELQEKLNQSSNVQSLMQMQRMLSQSPRVVAQARLAEAMNSRNSALQPQQTIQRQEMLEEKEEPLQAQFDDIQREALSEDEEPVQGKFEPVEKKENRTGLPDNLKAGIETISGMSMDDVKVHYNSSSPAQLQALAYTKGTDIHVGPGQEKHLSHEAWHVAQQKQGRVKPTMQLKGIAVNDDPALEREADVIGAKAYQMKPAHPTTGEAEALGNDSPDSSGAIVQRRTSVAGETIVTEENAGEIGAYIESKRAYDQEEEDKLAKRQGREPRIIPGLGIVPLDSVIEQFKKLYDSLAPDVPLDAIIIKLKEWANAKGPSEVGMEGGVFPLVSTQDNSFGNYKELFRAVVGNIMAERSRMQHEEVAFEVLENLSFYMPTLKLMLQNIAERIKYLPEDITSRMIKAGYNEFLLTDLPPNYKDLVYLILSREKEALRQLYLAISTIHGFALATGQLFPKRKEIEETMSKRRGKYSPYGPEIESAREKGYAVWAGFSGSTGDILYLAENFGLPPEKIADMAALTTAFFYFLPTSKNPTHTLHEVMEVANKYFNVPYDPANPKGILPHVLSQLAGKSTKGEQREFTKSKL